ncbi:MAG TPA: glutamate-cysteine ligase family protein, partial [Acidimicrobiia bacterium]|nr:glutamate-cysteine ligase family protein [Acidimicrobiia bacterium]
VWDAIDRCRAAPVGDDHGDARRAWVQYVFDAPVMLIRTPDGFEPLLDGLTLREWVTRGHRLGSPTVDDLEYHLTTLFPPVRPRGWLELRMIDALPDPWWRAAVAVTTVLMDDDEAAALVRPALEATRGLWTEAARDGLDHPMLASAAQKCFTVAISALPRHSADALTLGAVAEFDERYVSRGRCPADDRLHEWKERGVTEPPPDRFLEHAWS